MQCSGTLSPLEVFAQELMVPFPVRLENPHVVSADQVLVTALRRGVTGKVLNSTYDNRSKPEYARELGATIANFARIVRQWGPSMVLAQFAKQLPMTPPPRLLRFSSAGP